MLPENNNGKAEQDDDAKLLDESSGRAEMMQRFGLIRTARECLSDDENATIDEEDLEETFNDAASMGTTQEECKSHLTNYSMSSALLKQMGGPRQLDEHFEHIYNTQYAEEADKEESANGEDDNDEANTSLIEPSEAEHFRELLGEKGRLQQRFPRTLPDPELKNAVLHYAKAKEAQECEGEETEKILLPADGAKRGRWDCESIVSTYSTIYNHPTEIRETSTTQIGNKRKLMSELQTKLGSNNNLELMEIDQQCAQSVRSSRVSTASTFRPKNETPEERRARKQAIKSERRERREEKKANRVAFHQQKLAMDAQKHGTAQQKVRPIH